MAISVGIIGFGYMGHFHLRKARQIQGVQVVAAFDIDDSKRTNAINEGMKAFDTLDAFLHEEIDLVLICTPNNWHATYAIEAMKAGKHVMCEKPATLSVAELDAVMACSKSTGMIFTVHQNRRWDVDYLKVVEVVRSKEIGRITTIESTVMGERGVCYGWRADPISGGGMLYDWGVHLIDQMLQLFEGEKVTSVYARILSILTPVVDDFFEINMQFSKGTCAKISVGTFALQKKPRWFIYGDRGTMILEDFTGDTGHIARIKGEVKGFDSVIGKKNIGPSRTMAPLEKGMLEELTLPTVEDHPLDYWQNLVDAVGGKSIPAVSQSQVLRQMSVVEAAFLSAKQNTVVKVSI